MLHRSSQIYQLRPTIKAEKTEQQHPHEVFQNNVLRPILKLQHELILRTVENTPNFFSILSRVHTKEQYIREIKPFIQSQVPFKNQLIGMVTGMMTLEEYDFYSTNSAEMNKRITQMIIQRIADTVYKEGDN
jgi:hypothetical protein